MIRILFLILIVFNVFLSAYWLLQGDIHYDVDVSRDFLVMEDIVENRHLTLLGPRSGAIPGIFHGPFWFYVNLPAFFISGGNPILVGWFWWGLSIIFLWIVFWVTRRLFDVKIALLSVLLFSVNSIVNPSIGLKNFYNPYGAVFLFPIFFWLFKQYIISLKVKYLIFSLFILGLIIQFQMAFGIPILIATVVLSAYLLIKKKRLIHLFSYFILLIPLSTFIIFDMKHSGLQLNALIQFVNKEGNSSLDVLSISGDRIKALIFDCFNQLSPGKNFLTVFYTLFFVGGFIFILKKSIFQKTTYWLFGYLFLSFWIISLFYSGGVGNYFWPFLPLMAIIFCSFCKVIKKEIFIPVFIILYLVNFYTGISAILDFKTDINQRGPHSWAFNLQVAKAVFEDAKGDFGYFNFSPDRFSYQQRYAFTFAKRFFPNINSYSSTKNRLTYLIEVDPPKDRQDINSISWRIGDIKIEREPDQTLRFDFIQVEKYWLSDDEIKVAPNPYLLDSVFLR